MLSDDEVSNDFELFLSESDGEEDEYAHRNFDLDWLDENEEEEEDDSYNPWDDIYDGSFNNFWNDSETDNSHYSDDDKLFDDDQYNIDEERKFSGLRNAVIDRVSSDAHLQSGNKNIDDRYRLATGTSHHRSTLTHLAASKFGDFVISYLLTSPLDNTTMPTSSFYISKESLNPTTESECTPFSKLFIGNISPSVTRKRLKQYFDERNFPVKHIYSKKYPVNKLTNK